MSDSMATRDPGSIENLNSSISPNNKGRWVNNTKLARSLPLVDIKGGKGEITIDNLIPGRKDIHTPLRLISNQAQADGIRGLTDFDLEVADVVTTLIRINGVRVFDIDLVAKRMFPSKKATDKKKESIAQSLERLISTIINIYCQHEFDARHDIPSGKYGYKGQILPLNKITKNGKSVYIVLLLPNGQPFLPLYEYGKMTNEIITISYSWLATPTAYFQETEESICIRRRVLLRVKQILYYGIGPNNNKVALFWEDHPNSGIVPSLGYKVDRETKEWWGGPCNRRDEVRKKNWNRKKTEIQKVVEGTLHHLTDIGVIGGYKSYNRAGSKEVFGYRIHKATRTRKKAG